MYVVTGATGNIGSRIVENLLKQGKTVRMVGRSENKMEPWTQRGAQAQAGQLENTKFLIEAFSGATAVFTMIPPNLGAEDIRQWMNTIGRSIAEAVEEARVKWVVNLSSVGAHLETGAGIVQGLHDMENYLNKIDGLNVLHLRPAYFMENLFETMDMIKNMNIVGGVIDPQIKMPMVATVDIANVAAERLMNRDFIGKSVQYVLGPRDVSFEEITKLLSDRLDNEKLNYVQFPGEDTINILTEMGISESAARAVIELYEGINKGIVHSDVVRTEQTTTPTSIEQFAETFVEVYNQ